MLHLKLCSHVELRTLLDLEWLVLESLLCVLGREIDGDGRLAFGVHGEGEDDAVAWVVGVGKVLAAAAETERLLVALHGFIVGVCEVLDGNQDEDEDDGAVLGDRRYEMNSNPRCIGGKRS